MSVLDDLGVPIVQAPMAGGPSTPELAAAVARAGGLGFLAAGYLTATRLREELDRARQLTAAPLGVNLFIGGGHPADSGEVHAYADRLAAESARTGVALGEPTFDDDDFAAKLELLVAQPVAVVSFTFGLPPRDAVDALQVAGSEVWATVTSPQEARAAERLGADALVVQGVEAGGHRGVFVDDGEASGLSLLAALQLVRAETTLPLIAAGAIATGAAVGAVLVAGAAAAQIGTAYLRTPEAGTSRAQRDATATATPTVLTRAFSGRTARGIVNRFHRQHGAAAPRAYPEVHYLTAPLRAHGRAVGDADLINLWAGEAHELADERPAEEMTRALAEEAHAAIGAAGGRCQDHKTAPGADRSGAPTRHRPDRACSPDPVPPGTSYLTT